MRSNPVKLTFHSRRRIGRKSWSPSYVVITFPTSLLPKMLPNSGSVKLFATATVNRKTKQASFNFSLVPRDEKALFAGLFSVDTLIGLGEVWIMVSNIDVIIPKEWKKLPEKHAGGVLKDSAAEFSISFSLSLNT